MSDSLKYTTAQIITLKSWLYALLALMIFTLITMCVFSLVFVSDLTKNNGDIYNSTSFFHPFKVVRAFSIVLFLCGYGFGRIINIYKKSESTLLIKHFGLKYLIQFLIIAFAIATYMYSESLIPIIENIQESTESDWVLTIINLVFFLGVFLVIKDLYNNRKDYVKIDKNKIEFFNSAIINNEDKSLKIEEFNSVNNIDVKKVELQFEIDDDVKSLESIKFILKSEKEVVMDLEEMSLSSYENLIQEEIKSRFKGLITESSNLSKK